MSETIKAILTADSADLQAELGKAASAVQAWEKRFTGRKIPLPALELNEKSLQQMEAAAARSQALGRNLQQLQSSGKNGSLGLLAISQAAEDAQYGLKGVLNNIPQAVLGLGGSAGLAGALSLAAVGAYTAWNAFNRISESDAMEKWAKDSADATNQFALAITRAADATARLNAENQAASDRASQSLVTGNAITRDLGTDPAFQERLRDAAEAAARQRALQDAVRGAAGDSSISGEDFRQRGAREWQQAAIKAKLEERRATEDLAIAQENLNRLSEQYARIQGNLEKIITPLQQQRSTAQGEAEDLRRSIASKEAELARNKTLAEKAPDGSADQKRLQERNTALEKQLADERAISEEKKKQADLADQLVNKALQQAAATKQNLESQASSYRAQRDAARETLSNLAAINEARAKAIQFDALRGQNTTLQENADTAQQQQEAANAFADELEMAAAGLVIEQKKREQLIEQIKLRKEAADLAEQTGMSEEQAFQRVKLLADTRKKAENQPTGTIKERADARAEERAKERQRKRDEAVQEAQLQREEQKRERERKRRLDPEKDPIDPKQEADRVRKEAEEKAKQADKDIKTNLEKQTKIQESIQKMLEKIGAA